MANKQIDELTEKTDVLVDDDLILVYDSEEAGSEKTKKVPIGNYIGSIRENENPFNLYVSSTGSDTTGDGSSGNPWATPNYAIWWIGKRHIHPNANIVINFTDGTYNLTQSIVYGIASNRVHLLGNSGTPANVIFNFPTGSGGLLIQGAQSFLYVDGIKFAGYNKAEWKIGIWAEFGACCSVTNCIADGWGNGGAAQLGSNMLINGSTFNNCIFAILGYQQGDVYMLNGTLSNSDTGAGATEQGRVFINGTTYTGNSGNTYEASGGIVTTI
jgi:hypothetical protein